jgi:hypothetical protein
MKYNHLYLLTRYDKIIIDDCSCVQSLMSHPEANYISTTQVQKNHHYVIFTYSSCAVTQSANGQLITLAAQVEFWVEEVAMG